MTEREIRREVERAFYEYKDLKQKAAEYIAEAATNNLGVDYSRVRVSGCGADAEDGIVIALDHNQKNYLWCRVVELTKERFSADTESIFIIDKYFKGARRYRRSRMLSICSDLYLSERSFYYYATNILNYATLLALQFHLVNLVEKI